MGEIGLVLNTFHQIIIYKNHKNLESTIKPIYSCMPNIRSKVKGHGNNRKILQTKPTEPQNYTTALLKKIAQWMDYV